jgi:hypothetical protein
MVRKLGLRATNCRDFWTTSPRKSRGLRIIAGFFDRLYSENPAVCKSLRDFRSFLPQNSRGLQIIAGFTPKIPLSSSHRGIFDRLHSKIPALSKHRGISDRLVHYENSAVSNHRGIFEQLHSENPAVCESLRDYWSTLLRKSRGLRVIAGTSINFTPKIPRSSSHGGIFDRLDSENPAVFESSRDFGTTSPRESRGLRVIAGFSIDFTPKMPWTTNKPRGSETTLVLHKSHYHWQVTSAYIHKVLLSYHILVDDSWNLVPWIFSFLFDQSLDDTIVPTLAFWVWFLIL